MLCSFQLYLNNQIVLTLITFRKQTTSSHESFAYLALFTYWICSLCSTYKTQTTHWSWIGMSYDVTRALHQCMGKSCPLECSLVELLNSTTLRFKLIILGLEWWVQHTTEHSTGTASSTWISMNSLVKNSVPMYFGSSSLVAIQEPLRPLSILEWLFARRFIEMPKTELLPLSRVPSSWIHTTPSAIIHYLFYATHAMVPILSPLQEILEDTFSWHSLDTAITLYPK